MTVLHRLYDCFLYWAVQLRAKVGIIIEKAVTFGLYRLTGKSLPVFLDETHPALRQMRTELLKRAEQQQTVVFTFRTLHFVDFFVPIHLALERLYPGKFAVLYVDFAVTLRRIGAGPAYLIYRQQVQERLVSFGIDPRRHFSHQELAGYWPKGAFDVGVTSEKIRQETLHLAHRIYLPHYCLPKAVDRTLPDYIRFTDVFLPTRPPFSYASINNGTEPNPATIHRVGYPKEHIPVTPRRFFTDSKPVIIFAPSLDIPLLKKIHAEGICDVFRQNTRWNIIFKFHPSLESRRHYITGYFRRALRNLPHVTFDAMSTVSSMVDEADLLIADFGNVGCEFRLGSRKRLIYLSIPQHYEGGADLIFRDTFADAVCSVAALPETIENVLTMGPLDNTEHEAIRRRILSCDNAADEAAAVALAGIAGQPDSYRDAAP